MALTHSTSKIPTDGLVLYLDAANQKSYPGTGASYFNLVNPSSFASLVSSPTYDTGVGGFFVSDLGSYINIGDASLYFPTGSIAHTFSIELWVKTNVEGIVFGNQQISGERLYLGIWNGTWDFGWGSLPWGSGIVGTSSINTGDWTNLTLNLLSGVATLFVNGAETITKTETSVNITGNLPVGAYFGPGGGYDGGQSNLNSTSIFKIYNTSLSSEEIRKNFNATKSRFGL